MLTPERSLPDVEWMPVHADNWYACTQLEVTPAQKHVFPVPVVYWLAESAYCGFTPLALYANNQLAGLGVYAVDTDDGTYWIMAFMIDRHFQRQGLGRAGMEKLIRHMQEMHGCETILLGHRHNNTHAAALYASLGFTIIRYDEQEVVRELRLAPG